MQKKEIYLMPDDELERTEDTGGELPIEDEEV